MLIASSTSLKSQFNLGELREIRKYQIKSFYCDSLLENRQLKISQQHLIIQTQTKLITNFEQKEVIQLEEVVYYRELILKRDKKIAKLIKRNKLFRIGFISFGSSTAILLLINQIN
jgi:hypothetical protein